MCDFIFFRKLNISWKKYLKNLFADSIKNKAEEKKIGILLSAISLLVRYFHRRKWLMCGKIMSLIRSAASLRNTGNLSCIYRSYAHNGAHKKSERNWSTKEEDVWNLRRNGHSMLLTQIGWSRYKESHEIRSDEIARCYFISSVIVDPLISSATLRLDVYWKILLSKIWDGKTQVCGPSIEWKWAF